MQEALDECSIDQWFSEVGMPTRQVHFNWSQNVKLDDEQRNVSVLLILSDVCFFLVIHSIWQRFAFLAL